MDPHNGDVAATNATNREEYVRRGRRLEYFTIGYNSLEGVISIAAGLIAGSVSLVGFGLDSLIEVTSGAALVWRLHHDLNAARREQVERTALRTVGACFIALAMYILYESSSMLVRHVPPKRSIAGIVIASASVIVMPLLVRSSRRSLARFEKRQYLAVVSSAQFRKAVLDKLHHLTPVELVLFDGLCDEGEAGPAAGLYQLAGAVGLYPDVTGFLNGRLQYRQRRVAIGPVDRVWE